MNLHPLGKKMSLEDIEKAIKDLDVVKVVSCPLMPLMIPGIAAADALDANDAMGRLVELAVPRWGEIVSATLFDIDDEGTQIDLEIFNAPPDQIASDAAWTLSATDILKFITELAFFAFDDHIATQTSELLNIGKLYSVPLGKFFIQAVTRSTPTIAAGASPRFQLQIKSFDPEFVES